MFYLGCAVPYCLTSTDCLALYFGPTLAGDAHGLSQCTGVAGTPLEIRRAALHSMRRLLPRMPLAGSSAAVLHPLLRVLDGSVEELRRDAADTICSVAIALGPDFALFVPTISRVSFLSWPDTHPNPGSNISLLSWLPPPQVSSSNASTLMQI